MPVRSTCRHHAITCRYIVLVKYRSSVRHFVRRYTNVLRLLNLVSVQLEQGVSCDFILYKIKASTHYVASAPYYYRPTKLTNVQRPATGRVYTRRRWQARSGFRRVGGEIFELRGGRQFTTSGSVMMCDIITAAGDCC